MVDGVAPADPSRFERCLDMFDGTDPAALEAARRQVAGAQGQRRYSHLLGANPGRGMGARA